MGGQQLFLFGEGLVCGDQMLGDLLGVGEEHLQLGVEDGLQVGDGDLVVNALTMPEATR